MEAAQNQYYDRLITELDSRLDKLDTALDNIRTDHVQRREVDEIKTNLAVSMGRRTIVMVVVSAALSISLVLFGVFIADRQNIQGKIAQLQESNHQEQLQLVMLQDKLNALTTTK